MSVPANLQPTLVGTTVVIRPLVEADREELFTVASDPLIWAQHPTKDRWTRSGFDLFFNQSLASGGALVIQERTETGPGRIIGSSRYHGYDPAASCVEIGWTFLARDHWGGQTNSEVKRLMLTHAHSFVDRVVLIVDNENARSRRAVEKIGGRPVGTRADTNGRTSIVYAVDAGRSVI
jgi:RimJ/RimL family protein N-acetyltransferase